VCEPHRISPVKEGYASVLVNKKLEELL